MATLYRLTDDYAELMAALEAAETEEQASEIWAQIDAKEEDIAEKAEAYARILRNKQAEAEAFKAEAQRLARCQKAAEAVAEHLKAHLQDCMTRLDLKEIQTGIGKWRVQMNPPACQVLDEAAIPEEYRIPQPDKIDRTAILRHYKATGEILPGVDVTQSAGIRFR